VSASASFIGAIIIADSPRVNQRRCLQARAPENARPFELTVLSAAIRVCRDMRRRSLTLSITRTVALLLAAQAVVMGVCSLIYGLAAARIGLFLLIAVIYHGLLLGVLLTLRPLFVLVDDDRPLDRINVSNVLSLVRLTSLPSIVFLIVSAREASLVPVILPYVVLVFLTDLVDGWLARRFHQITSIGRYLDAVSDYMLLSATLFVYLWYALIPWWFFLLVVVRLGVVAAGNTLLYVAHGQVEPETSYLGKASIFSIMVLFAAKVLGIPYVLLFSGPSPLTIERLDNLQLMVAGVLVVSAFEKINLFGAKLKDLEGAAAAHLRERSDTAQGQGAAPASGAASESRRSP
jgi:phosphatidylglycerophosphate synthase